MTEYAVVLEQSDDGSWWAYAPDIPGVISGAETAEKAEARFHGALDLYREELVKSGQELPPSRARSAVVSV